MKKIIKKTIIILVPALIVMAFVVAVFTIFFDQAIIVRKETFYRAKTPEKVVALTFDDGPSPLWTPRILIALKQAGVKGTFFMLGEHVEKYPEVARQVAAEGHDIGIHSYRHNSYIYYTKYELENDLKNTEAIIKKVTGLDTKLFRPPKAWLSKREKKKIKEFGYKIILWSLNSKDWVNFDDKYIVNYLVKNVRPGDIILFHDSGGVFGTEGGSRKETVLAIPRLVEKLKEKGYRCISVTELLEMSK